MNNDINQQKNNVLSSIMANPKLARTFKEAMAAPIGSTKRAQAQSMLSIIKKVGGNVFDGQGGMFDNIGLAGSSMATSTPSPQIPYAPNYSNLMIFPAAPALKSTATKPANNSVNSGNITYPAPTPVPQTNWFDTAWNTVKNLSSNATNSFVSSLENEIPGMDMFNSAKGIMSSLNSNKPDIYTPGVPQPAPYQNVTPGAVSRITNALPTAGLGIVGGSLAGLTGLAQFGLQNAMQGSEDLYNWGADSNQQIPKNLQPGYIAPMDTAGQQALKGMWDKSFPTTAGAPSSPPMSMPTTTGPITGSSVAPSPDSIKMGWTPTTPEQQQQLSDTQNYLVQNGYMTTAQASGEKNVFGPNTTAAYSKAYGDEQTKMTGSTSSAPAGGNTATSTSGANLAAANIAKMLGCSPFDDINKLTAAQIASKVPINEGFTNGTSSVAVRNNNPGNLKYAGQAGATADARGFAVFQTVEAGQQALVNDIQSKMNSGKYKNLNDLFAVYSPNSDNPAYTGGNTSSPYSTGSATDAVASAVSAGTGAEAFGIDYANAKFNGGLDQYVQNLDTKLKNQYNLPALEQQLSNLKDTGADLIPTLQTYMSGRDTYLKSIDAMIQTTQDKLSTLDASDPKAMSMYNLQMNNLYDLKGKQEGRYQNFLNSAIADYNADVSKVTSAYTQAKSDYTTALNSQATMAQNDYNNLYTRMTSAYTALQNAPITLANQNAALAQLGVSNLNTVTNGFSQSSSTNPKTLTDIDNWSKQLTIGGTAANKDDINFTNIPANGLIGLYELNAHAGSDPASLTEAIRRGLKATLESNSGNNAVVTKVKKLITDLAADPRGKTFAQALSNSISPSTGTALGGYAASHMADVQKAVNDLVNNSGGFLGMGQRKPGIQDKASWLSAHKNLDPDFLNSLYDFVNANAAGFKNPNDFLDKLFPAGSTDQQKASILASGLAVI